MLGIDTNYPRRTFRVRDLTSGQVVTRQAIIWYPTADAGEAVSSDTATTGGGEGATRALFAATVSEEQESKQHEPQGAGEPESAFELERVEHETGGAFGPEGQLRRT